MTALNTIEIKQALKKLEFAHCGVYAADTLPKKIRVPCGIVVNTEPKNQSGAHWVAIFINKNNYADFFDSFGMGIVIKNHLHFIKKHAKSLKYNTLALQGQTSAVCGHYCLLFLKYRSQNRSYHKFLTTMSHGNAEINDRCAEELFLKYFVNGRNKTTTTCQSCRPRQV